MLQCYTNKIKFFFTVSGITYRATIHLKENHLEKLFKGIRRFQESYYKKEKALFKRLAKGQNPSALFITCVDSRVDPNLLTQSMPGELLTLRTPGNIVMPFEAIKDASSSAGTIEFAVMELKIKNIIVCGHSGCRAIEVLRESDEKTSPMKQFHNWLNLAVPVRNNIQKNFANETPEARQRHAEEENILHQLQNIQTYPCVDQAVKDGKLNLHGWYYDIYTGTVNIYNSSSSCFEPA